MQRNPSVPPAGSQPRQPVFLAGPTASGKSAVAMALAEQLGGEIVSVDSMQVYRGMDIGTAKPTSEERRQVPHHLIDILDLSEIFDAARFVSLARAAAEAIQGRGRTPIFCGGTGLYFKAYLEGLTELPAADPELRRRLGAMPLDELCRELDRLDPAARGSVDCQNQRRVIRAVEIVRMTGRPLSEARAQQPPSARPGPAARPLFFCLSRTTEDLRQRIDARVDAMFAAGLVEETRELLGQGLADNPAALQALGYRQTVEFLNGVRTLPETIELVKARTRQFARRQRMWFRHQAAAEWLRLAPEDDAAATAEAIRIRLEQAGRTAETG